MPKKKLRLGRETLRALSTAHLDQVAGAATTVTLQWPLCTFSQKVTRCYPCTLNPQVCFAVPTHNCND